ncbi:ribonuclease HII [Corynebacterium sp. sy039]|uniref:ribonuclease HII n=1 Tax=Corynebacterium sp. sy039 TaxID=2599641 RepID=UPI0011B84EAD|nr:ribonuclease HII [Corynebacterium sp. sy039]QDZ42833.1 ribonuclease HII [Corynebacterium sp. sy039]
MRTLKQLRTLEVTLEKHGLGPVAGVDEAGRGASCGPISIAACILPPEPIAELSELTDSKQLSADTRQKLYPLIKNHARAYAIVHIDAADIDRHGIQHANISGMRRAIALLGIHPGYILTDAMKVPGLASAYLPIIGGDSVARCIAAASVLAKHSRDELMCRLDERYPEYGLAQHKGYSTKNHMEAVRRHGASPEHRYSYENVRLAHAAWTTARRGA